MKNPVVERVLVVSLWLGLCTILSGVNYCQRSYTIGAQSNLTESPTESPTATDDGLTASETETPTETDTTTETATETPTATATATATSTATASLVAASQLYRSLQKLNNSASGEASDAVKPPQIASAKSPFERTPPSNWLGQLYLDQEVPGAVLDSDNDGYSDKLEKDFGTDPNDARSEPPTPVTDLTQRLQGHDDDGDGVSNDEEIAQRTNPLIADSDGDGVKDGAEILSDSDPLVATKKSYNDFDGDGLSDTFEISIGLNFRSKDSDGDEVPDDVEVGMKMNPLSNDTDNDGVLDWKELELKSDPLKPEKLEAAP